ncbi:MAG: hypothetical protein ACE5OQ_13990 [Woeseia sp.]
MDNEDERRNNVGQRTGWGATLFIATLVALAVFFWWLLIYSGGVVVNHGS